MSKKKKIIVLSVCICLALVIMGGTLAWYSREDAKRARTDKAPVMAPYNLYLLKPNAKDTLRFAVGNLHPGETKQTVICVSNKRPDDYEGEENDMSELVKDSVFGYDLMLVHTENLAIQYTVYPLERTEFKDWYKDHVEDDPLPDGAIVMDDETMDVCFWTKVTGENGTYTPLSGDDMTPDMRARVGTDEVDEEGNPVIVNAGTYWISNDDGMELAYYVDEETNEGEYEFDYYLIEINWDDIDDFDSYRKETDLVYVVVNAKQPRPILKESAVQLNEDSGVLIDGKSENLTNDAD